jgi:RNA polymerase sigma factor (sigma-70 family)
MTNDPQLSLRLERIETQWSLIKRAHGSHAPTAAEARQTLVLRYSSAIRRYVGAMTGNQEDSHEIAQDVIVKLLQGDFAGADVERGRFRDLLKTAIRNMVRNFWSRQQRRRPAELDLDQVSDEPTGQVDPWLDGWRKNVLELTWSALENYEREHEGRIPYTILQLRSKFPTASSQQLADHLSQRLGRPVEAPAVRQQLRRARLRFADLLVREVAEGLDQPTPDRIQEELVNLGLFEYVKDLLPKT